MNQTEIDLHKDRKIDRGAHCANSNYEMQTCIVPSCHIVRRPKQIAIKKDKPASSQAVTLSGDGAEIVATTMNAFVVFRLSIIILLATLAMWTCNSQID